MAEEREQLEGAFRASAHPWLERRRISNSSADPKPHIPESLKAALNVLLAEEQALDGPEDVTHKMTAQIRLYAHLFKLINAYYRVSLYAHHVVGVS